MCCTPLQLGFYPHSSNPPPRPHTLLDQSPDRERGGRNSPQSIQTEVDQKNNRGWQSERGHFITGRDIQLRYDRFIIRLCCRDIDRDRWADPTLPSEEITRGVGCEGKETKFHTDIGTLNGEGVVEWNNQRGGREREGTA